MIAAFTLLFHSSVLLDSSAADDGINGKVKASWRIIAKAPLIVTGKMLIPLDKFKDLRAIRSYEYIDIPVKVSSIIKGEHVDKLMNIKYQPKGRSDAPYPDILLSFDRKEAVFFLEYNDWPEHQGIYFVSHPPSDALIKYSQIGVEQLKHKVQLQYEIITKKEAVKHDDEYDKEVRRIINNMMTPAKAERAYTELLNLDKYAVFAIIDQMNDFRDLPVKMFTIESPRGFSKIYQPKCVVDVMATVLNEITGESFGRIYNGGSERERLSAYQGWCIWKSYNKDNPDYNPSKL